MVRRIGILTAAVLAVAAVAPAVAPAAHASKGAFWLAQEPESETQDDTGTAEETGAGEAETGGATEETGPPWTYQMSRISVLLTLFMFAGIALAYYRFVVKRRRGDI